MVYCGFPGEADRLAILQAVASKLALCADISLQDVAAATEGFTGADLAAILSEAQLLAVHDQIDTRPGSQLEQEVQGDEASASACVLTAQHVQRALTKARPSLPATEKRRLEAVYARFQQSRDPGLSNRPAVPEAEQSRVKHATLA
jgi:peroxin-1